MKWTERTYEWRPWFAWYPVKLSSRWAKTPELGNTWAWLEWVERFRTNSSPIYR